MSVLKRYTGSDWVEVGGASILTQPSAPATPVDGQLWIDSSTVGVGNIGVVDLTNATEDYPLQIGETVTITYTNVTSVPLYVATSEGLYQFSLISTDSTIMVSGGHVMLSPNNVSSSIPIQEQVFVANNSGAGAAYTASNILGFTLGSNSILYCKVDISTITTNKTVHGSASERFEIYNHHLGVYGSRWDNIITPWTSLGTVRFPSAQSGKIVIRRII